MRARRGSFRILIALAFASLSGAASADTWPIARHDAARTGASQGVFLSGAPSAVWRSYMGGVPRDATARFGLASASITVASRGGRFIAKDVLTQDVVWQSDLYGSGRVADITDVDGDGSVDVVVSTEDRAYVLDAATGAPHFISPPGAFGRIGAVRVADMNGDGVADVYIDDGSGAKTGALTAAAYSFAGGFGAAVELWSRPVGASPPPINSGTDAIVDLNGDGVTEVALASYDEVLLVSGGDGATITSLVIPGSSGHPFSHADAIASELDGFPGAELLVVQPNGQVASQSGPPGFSAFKVDPLTKTSEHLWTRRDSSYEAEIVALADTSVDLDGDGDHEVIFSHRSPATGLQWVTEVLDGATGSTLTSIVGARFEGAAELDGAPGDELVVATASGLQAYAMSGGALALIAAPLPGLRAITMVDPSLRRLGQINRRLAVLERPSSPKVVLAGAPPLNIAYADLPTVNSFVSAAALTLGPQGFSVGDTYTPLTGLITDAIRADFATRPYPQAAMGTTFGTLDVLDDSMKVTNGVFIVGEPPAGTTLGGATQPTSGVMGGPLIGADGLGPFVVLPGSPKGLFVANAAGASWISPPAARWVQPGLTAPSIVSLGGPESGVAVVGVEGYSLTARSSATGALVGSRDLGPGMPWGTPLPLHIPGSLKPLVGIDWRVEGVQIVQSAVNFALNTTVWVGSPLAYGGFFGSGVGDLDGDGADEWYSMNGPLNRRSAVTGALDVFPALSTGYSIPMTADFDGAPGPELLLQSGGTGPKLVTSAMVQAWEGPLPEPMNVMAGAHVVCPGGARFFTPAVQSPWLYAFDGLSGALLGSRVLAGGSLYPSVAAAEAAGARVGSLTNASSVANGDGPLPAVLVGSSDGHLYALSACSLDLLWSKDLGAPVAEPVVGDIDADGFDEIVVGAADGYIYGLDWPSISPPDEVTLVGAPPGGGALVVAVLEPVTVNFSPVAGAAGYEIALVGPDDRALWSPPYRAVAGTQAVVSLDGALAGRPYRIFVRAIGPSGPSDHAASSPIFIADVAPPSIEAHGAWDAEERPVIEVAASDDLALDHCLTFIREDGDDGAAGQPAGDEMLSGKAAQASVGLAVPGSLWGARVRIAVDAIDSGGNAARSLVFANVTKTGEVLFEPKATPGFGAPADVGSIGVNFGDRAVEFGGCAASGRRAGGEPGGAAFVSGLGLAIAIARRRSHTRKQR